VKNPEVRFFHALWFATVPLQNTANFSQSRFDTRVWRRDSPAHGGEAAAGFACGESPNARNVKIFYRMLYPRSVKNPEPLFFR
jgi:hypothetical protein